MDTGADLGWGSPSLSICLFPSPHLGLQLMFSSRDNGRDGFMVVTVVSG